MDHETAQDWLDRYVERGCPTIRATLHACSPTTSRTATTRRTTIAGRDAVVASWLRQSASDDASTRDAPGTYEAEYSPVAVDGDTVVATGTSRYREVPDAPIVRTYEDCFIMRFDGEGRCSEFTEYYIRHP
jgi:hypothetical protein